VQGGHPDQRGTPLSAQRAQRRQVEQPRAGTDRANARDTPQPRLALAPDRTGAPGGIQVVVASRQALIAPRDRRLDIGLEPEGRTRQAVLCGRPPGDQWSPPSSLGAEIVGVGGSPGKGGLSGRR